jgi:hypothetical protein
MKRKIDDSCNDSLEQKYKPKSNKKHKSLNEPVDSLSNIDSSDNESSDDSSSDAEAEDWFIFSKALDTKQPDDVVSENINTKPRNNIWMNGMNGMKVKVKVEESVEVVEVVEETMTNISDCKPDDVVSEKIPTKPRNNIWMNVKVKVEESVEVVEEMMTNISDCQPDDVVSENIPTKPRNNIWMNKMNGNVKVKVEETVGGTMKENL